MSTDQRSGSGGPEFVVDIPPYRRAEREYALAVLLGEWLGRTFEVRVVEDLTETHIRLADGPADVTIVLPDVLLAPETEWLSQASLPRAPLAPVVLPAWSGIEDTVPFLYATGLDDDEVLHQDGSRFRLRLDLLGSLVFLLTRYEEYVQAARRDTRDRFPASASVLSPSGWLHWPILDMYVHLFAALVRLAWPGSTVEARPHEGLIVGHDVDHPSSSMLYPRLKNRLHVLAGDIVKRRDLGLAVRRVSTFVPGRRALTRYDPLNTFDFLMGASEAHGLRSTFFFLTMDTEIPDGSRYRVDEAWAPRLMAAMARRGHAIGLHGSYNSFADADRLRAEWTLLEAAARDLPDGALQRTIRQHFLRFRPGTTWSAQAEAGLLVDESLGFADDVGYRAGTARSFPAFDLRDGRTLPLRVKPLHVMDATLLQYLSVGDDEAFGTVAAMGRRTRRFGGALSFLWHNSSLETSAARRLYLRLLGELAG